MAQKLARMAARGATPAVAAEGWFPQGGVISCGVVQTAILRRLGIEPGEGRLFASGAAALFLLGWAEVSVKNVGETLFFKRVGVDKLPEVFLINAVLLIGTTYLAGRAAAKTDRLKLLPRVFVLLGLALIPMWYCVLQNVSGALGLLVIASKQLGSIGLLVFWVALADLLRGRQSKRLFAPLMAGETLGEILGSFASEPLSKALGITGPVPIAAGALVLGAAAAWPLRHMRGARLERKPDVGSRAGAAAGKPPEVAAEASAIAAVSPGRFRELWGENRLFRLLLVVTACSGLVGPMLYFQFSYVADLATQGAGAEQKLMAFYAVFRGWIGIGVLATQLGFASTVYRRIGIPLSAAVSPLIYLIGFFGLSVRLSLPVGVGAMAGTKLQDNAIFDPAVRILFNLLPESIRARALVLLEGPVKRSGGAAGNLAVMGAVSLGSAAWVGWIALPISAVWLVAAVLLWRSYPALLMQVSSRRSKLGADFDPAEFLDPNTLRALTAYLLDPDPARCRVAVELVRDARPELAVGILATAIASAPPETRPILISGLDEVLEIGAVDALDAPEAAGQLARVLEEESGLSGPDRTNLIQAYGRLTESAGSEGSYVLTRALGDAFPAARLAAAAALHLRGTPPQGVSDLRRELAAALASDDPVVRETAREEYRARLLRGNSGETWEDDLEAFAALPVRAGEWDDHLRVLADVAARSGKRASGVSAVVLEHRDDREPRVLVEVLRFIGHAGLGEHAGWVVGFASYADGAQAEGVRNAAAEALRALGIQATDALLVELSFGKRSARDAILPILRELHIEPAAIREVYERELASIRRELVTLTAAVEEGLSPILQQRLGERVDEGVHTVLKLLAALHDDDRIAALPDPMRRARGSRQYDIALEALESLLSPAENEALMPLLADRTAHARGQVAARALGVEVPRGASFRRSLRESPDELTRRIAEATIPAGEPGDRGVAAAAEVQEDAGVLTPIERAMLLRKVPLFEGMTTRQLMNVAEVVEQEVHPPHSIVAEDGEYSDCMYIIVDGVVAVTKGGRELRKLGPTDFFGEIAVFEGARRTANVTTLDGEVRLLRLKRDDLLSLMAELPEIAILICQKLSGLVHSLTERLQGESPEG